MSKAKITQIGQPCRKCNTPVKQKTPTAKPKAGQKYRFKSYLYCPKCKTMYMLESQKVYIKEVESEA